MKLLFATSNDVDFARHLKAGYCFGMSCDWAKKSLQSVRKQGVKHVGELEEFKWAIGQTAYETKDSADTALITGMGLQVESHVQHPIVTWANVCAGMHDMAGFGTFIFCIEGTGGGHAMGYRKVRTPDVLGRETTSLQWLDPNIGLVDFANRNDFVNNASHNLNLLYGTGEPDPNDRLDNSYELFKVKL